MALFTAENAAEMAKRAAEAKLAAKEQSKLAALSPEVEADFAEKHRKLRLLRVRKQQERIDAMLLVEEDAAKIDRLASAAIRLNEQERQLSNRSLPPTVKAPAGKPRRQSSPDFSPKPIEIAPRSVVEPTSPGVSTDTLAQSTELPPL